MYLINESNEGIMHSFKVHAHTHLHTHTRYIRHGGTLAT